MKKAMNSALVYLILALGAGVFYREFTKANHFSGQTTLGVLHPHLLLLGTGICLLVAFVFKNTQPKHHHTFFTLYQVALPMMIITMGLRGIVQVKAISLSKALDASLSGIAGLSHLLLAVSLVYFLLAIRKNYLQES